MVPLNIQCGSVADRCAGPGRLDSVAQPRLAARGERTALVTGATGFIGRHLVAQLTGLGRPVGALYRDPQKREQFLGRSEDAIRGDACDPAVVRRAVDGMEVVFHCAAAHSTSAASEIHRTNVESVRCLLQAVRETGRRARVILMSSLNVLGNQDFANATEERPRRKTGELHVDLKIEAEELAERWIDNGLDIVVLRPGLVYGPGDPHLARLARAIDRKKFVFIGSRDHMVPLIHVSDMVQAMLLAAEAIRSKSRLFHITDGSSATIGELVECLAGALGCPVPNRVLPAFFPRIASRVCSLLGREGPVSRGALRFLGTSRHVDISRARNELGFEPRVSLPAGINSLQDWLRQGLRPAA